jgi:hypothetical protein
MSFNPTILDVNGQRDDRKKSRAGVFCQRDATVDSHAALGQFGAMNAK